MQCLMANHQKPCLQKVWGGKQRNVASFCDEGLVCTKMFGITGLTLLVDVYIGNGLPANFFVCLPCNRLC